MAGQLGAELQDRGVTIGVSFFQVTVDPPLIGAVASANVDVTVPGVAVGDEVYANPPDTMTAGLALQGASVSGANTVRIRLTNASAAGIDGAALVWRLMIVTHR